MNLMAIAIGATIFGIVYLCGMVWYLGNSEVNKK